MIQRAWGGNPTVEAMGDKGLVPLKRVLISCSHCFLSIKGCFPTQNSGKGSSVFSVHVFISACQVNRAAKEKGC